MSEPSKPEDTPVAAKEEAPAVAVSDKKADDVAVVQDTSAAPAPAPAEESKEESKEETKEESKEEEKVDVPDSPVKETDSANGSSKVADAPTSDATPLEPGTIVLGKLKGFPPWPAMVSASIDAL